MIADALSVLRAEVQIDPTGTPNLMPNPSGDRGAWFWVTPLRFTKITSVSGALRLETATGVGDAYTQSNPIRVAAGDYIGARFDTVGGTSGHEVKLRWRWFDLADNLLSESTQTSAFNTTPGTHYKSAVVAPAGTSYAKLKIDLYNSGGPPAANAHYDFQNVMVTTAAATFSNTYPFTEPVEYTNILGPTNSIDISRGAMEPGLIGVRVLDTSLDPADADALRTGRRFRVTALNDDTADFEDLVADLYIIRAEVAYDFTKPPDKQATISLTLTDSLQLLANSTRQVSVGTIDELPFVVETVGIPFNVNGETGTLLDDVVVTARIDQATGLDQVLLTRDSNQGYAWISKEGVLNAWTDRDTDFYGGAVTFDESSYSNIDVGFDTDKCINEVLVIRVVENPFTLETVEKTYGPYRDEAAVDRWKVVRQATFRVTGVAEVDVPAFAAAVLAANSVPVRRVNSITVPIRTEADITTAKALIDLYATANIINTAKGIDLDQHVTSISHAIRATARGVSWVMTLGFDVAESVSGPAPTGGASGVAIVKGAPRTVAYAQTGKTASVTRNATSTGAFTGMNWLISHDEYLQILSYTCDIFQADTYTLYIDGRAASAGVVCGAASVGNVFTVTTPKDLPPGLHTIGIRGTASRRYYYRNLQQFPLGGTYPNIAWGAWSESGGAGDQVAGTLTFNAEGSV